MFEIEFAGLAASAGLHPILGSEPDVLFEFENRRILVQCKRVLSEAKVTKRINEAAKQLKRNLAASSNPRDCGLIAISLSRLINPGDRILLFAAVADAERALIGEIQRVIERHKGDGEAGRLDRVFPGVEDPKVAGFILLMTSPVFIEKRGCFTVAKFGTVCPIPGRSDTVMLKRLGGRLRI